MDKLKDITKGLVGKGEKDGSHASYETPYVRKDPTLFPPPPRTKVYEPGTGPAPPPPKAHKPPLPERDSQASGDAVDGALPTQDGPSAASAKARPRVPPRLPPRQLDEITPVKEPNGYLNEEAVRRLGNAGITVHGLGIVGAAQPPPLPSRAAAPPVPDRKFGGQHMQELQSRFAKLNSAPLDAAPGKTTQESNPPSVLAADALAAGAAAEGFHDQNNEQVASGARAANQTNRRYGLEDRAKVAVPANGSALPARPPPPPRPNNGNVVAGSGPPPVPYASKPRG